MDTIRRERAIIGMALAVGFLAMSTPVSVRADDPSHTGTPLPGSPAPSPPPPPGDPPPPPPCPSAGDPVYFYGGEFEYVRDDISIPGKGMPLEITLRYWSQRQYNNRYGYGWFMCYDVSLVVLADNSIEVLWGCGGRENYTYSAGTYTPPPGSYGELVALGGGGYTLTQPDGTLYSFDTSGKLTSIADRNDNEITFVYDAGGALPIIGKTRFVTGSVSADTLAYDWMLTMVIDTKGDTLTFDYDTNGRLETITDYAGREWSYVHDTNDDLVSITTPGIAGFPSGLVTECDYDSLHHMLTVTDPEDQTWVTNTYYTDGRLHTQTLGAGTMTLEYNDTTHVTSVTDGKGFETDWVFDANGRLMTKKAYTAGLRSGEPVYYETGYTYTANEEFATITYPKNNSIEYDYDSRGNVTEVRRKGVAVSGDHPTDIVVAATYHDNYSLMTTFTDADTNTTAFGYDTNGNLTQITYPPVDGDTARVTITYTAAGQRELVTDGSGNELKYEYYAATGYLHKIRLDPDGVDATLELGYDGVGNITSIKDARDNTTTFAYNDMGWITTVTNPLGYQTKYTYDGNGNVEKVERQANTAATSWQTTRYTYTTTNLLKTITNPLNKVTTYNYDNNLNLSSVVDAEADTTRYAYDERNALWRIVNALADTTEYSYDENGNITAAEDASGDVTTYTFDDFDRFVRLTYDDSSYERVALSKNGNVDSLFVDSDLQALYFWDARSRLEMIVYANADTVTYAYDLGSKLVGAANAVTSLGYAYDALGRVDTVTTVVGGHTYVVVHEYDKTSNRTKLSYPSGYSVDFTYTELNSMDEIQRSGGTLVNYDHDTLGRRVFREIPATLRFIQSFYEYDGADRATRVLNKTLRPTGGEEEPNYEWGLRGIWHRLKRWANRPAWAGTGITISDFTYTYDDVGNRLTMSVDGGTHTYGYDAIHQLSSVSGAQSHSYDYDGVGNRVEGDNIDYTANNLNQYTVVNSVNFDYDAKGNLIDDGVNTYKYDSESRLDSVITATATVTFTYDPFGRRQMMSVNGTETYYIYDGNRLLAEYDDSGNLKREYVHGANLDEVVSLYRASPSSRYFYYQDGLGSISEILDSNGVLFEQYEYEPYGKTTIRNKNGGVISTSAVGNRFAFTGRWLDYETKLYDYRARAYSTGIGRFLQRDPLDRHKGLNPYTYAMNNPVNLVDPFGLQCSSLPNFQAMAESYANANAPALRDLAWAYANAEHLVVPYLVGNTLVVIGGLQVYVGWITASAGVASIPVTGPAGAIVGLVGLGVAGSGVLLAGIGLDIWLDQIRRFPGHPNTLDLYPQLDPFGEHGAGQHGGDCDGCP